MPLELLGERTQLGLLALALTAPWALLALLCLPPLRASAWRLLPWAAVPALAAAFLVGDGARLSLPSGLPGGGFGLDPLNRTFLLFSALLWSLAGWFGRSWLGEDAGRQRFAVFFGATMAGNLGLVLAQDLLAFYACFALMGFATYGLVVHEGSRAARHAGRVYLALLIAGEACLFTAVALSTLQLPQLGFAAFADPGLQPLPLGLFAVGFGIKLGVLGLHAWLPLAHPAAPLPASAVLSGALIKAGLLGWLRVAPPGSGPPEWGPLVILLGLAATFYGVLAGLLSRRPKTLLAYSSVSQMGLVTVLLGAALLAPAAAPLALAAVSLFALHHALAKAALFLGVGVIAHAPPAQRPLAWLGLLLLALALAGAPATSGALAKLAVADVGAAAGVYERLAPLLALSSGATLLLMARLLYLLRDYRREPRPASGLWLPWGLLIGGSLLLPWLWPGAAPWVGRAWHGEQLLTALWPLLLGALLVTARTPAARLAAALDGGWRRLRARLLTQLPPPRPRRLQLPPLARLERTLQAWPTIGKLLVALLLALLAAQPAVLAML